MVKSKVIENYSCRVKFKDSTTLEIVVMNQNTGEIFLARWNFAEDIKPVITASKTAKTDTAEIEEKGDILNDSNSIEE